MRTQKILQPRPHVSKWIFFHMLLPEDNLVLCSLKVWNLIYFLYMFFISLCTWSKSSVWTLQENQLFFDWRWIDTKGKRNLFFLDMNPLCMYIYSVFIMDWYNGKDLTFFFSWTSTFRCVRMYVRQCMMVERFIRRSFSWHCSETAKRRIFSWTE
jgi:hypothetical protein